MTPEEFLDKFETLCVAYKVRVIRSGPNRLIRFEVENCKGYICPICALIYATHQTLIVNREAIPSAMKYLGMDEETARRIHSASDGYFISWYGPDKVDFISIRDEMFAVINHEERLEVTNTIPSSCL